MLNNRSTRKILSLVMAFALALGAFAVSPMPAQAAAGMADEMAIGTWASNPRYITMGSYNGYPIVWRVLEVTNSDTDNPGNKTAFLVADDLLRTAGGAVETRQFHNTANNDWNGSAIYGFLNGTGAGQFFTAANFPDKSGIITSNYTYGGTYSGSANTGSSPVFLLSTDEANNADYFSGNADRDTGTYWWLRSPGLHPDGAAYVYSGGGVNPTGVAVRDDFGVRPALKIDLSSDLFTSVPVEYSVTITVTDGGGAPISGAKVTSARSAENFYTNSSGIAVFKNIPSGADTVTVTKAGYAVKQQGITVSGVMSETIALTADAGAMPDKVYFGKYNGSPIKWRVLDVDLTGGKALLFADTALFQHTLFGSDNVWNTSNLRDTLNDATSGFLQTSNFTAGEYASILQTTLSDVGTTDRVFALSSPEARLYMPDNAMRAAALSVWLRNVSSTDRVAYIAGNGDIDDSIGSPVSNGVNYARPAMWVDLTKLGLAPNTPASGDTTLTPLLPATVTVTAGSTQVNGAAVTLTPQAPLSATPRNAAGTLLTLSGQTASGAGAAFGLMPGTYSVAVTGASATGYLPTATGTLTVAEGGANSVEIQLTADNSAPSISSLSPANGAQNITTGAALTITFDKPVTIDSGDIIIFKASDPGNPVHTITSPGALGMISPQSGANTSYAITPSSALEAGTDYYVTIGSTFFKDSASNYFAGIADNSTWAFKTAAAPVLPTLTMATPTDDTATEGEVFSKTISVTYTGIGTLGYSATGLPLGLSMNTATGEISGTPDVGTSTSSPYNVTVTVSDGVLPDASGSFMLTVDTAPIPPVLTMATPTDDTATAGDLYRKTVSVTYTGANQLTYSAAGLPGSLSINPATGEISGLLTESDVGQHSITVTVSDGALPDASASFTLTVQTAIVPQPALTLTPAALSTGAVNSGYSASIAGNASGGTSPYSFAVTGGSLPAGLSLSSAGVISGTPTAAVTNQAFTVTVTDSANDTASASYTITINSVYVPPYHGGSDNDSYTPPVIWPVEVTAKPDFPTTARLTLSQAPDKNNALTCTITKEMVQQALDKAKEKAKADGRTEYGYALEFYFSTDKTISGMNITFDADALALLESAGIKETSVITNTFRFGLDLAAIKQLNSQSGGKAVTVSASRFSKLSDAAKAYIGSRPAWDVTVNFKKDGKTYNITSLGKGFITMGMKYSPTSGEKTGNLAVVYVPGSGKPQILMESSYDGGWMIWQRSSLSVYGVGYITPAPAFTDTVNHWAKDDIDFVASRELISGTTATTFSPNTAITRADFLMALGKLSGADVSGYTASSFTDVANTGPAMPYIEWAVKNKIVQGIGDNKFGPDNKITREDMAVMMVNYAKATGYTLPVSRQAVTFADDAKISAYAKDAVKAIQQAGIIVGKTGNLFDPQGSATRAEASTILRRFVELVIDEGTARGWVQNDSGQWQYINTYGKAVTSNWLTAGESKYWFDANGVMVSGKWLQIEGKWYYFDSDGKLAVNTTIDGYTVGADGARK